MDINKRNTLKSIVTVPVLAFSSGSSKAQEVAQAKPSEVSEIKQTEVEATLLQFMGKIPNKEEERLELVKETSKSVCDGVESISSKVNFDTVKTEALITDSTRGVLDNMIRNINTAYDVNISTTYLDEVGKLTKFVPVLSAGQNFLEACCKVREKISESPRFVSEMLERDEMHPAIENFYISMFLVLVELVLLPSSVGYRSSFMGTRYAANHGLVRVRKVVGLRLYSILLSIVHWALRGTIEGTISYIVSKSAELVQESEKYNFDFEAVDKANLGDYDFLEEDRKDQNDDWDFLTGKDDSLDTLQRELADAQSIINSSENGNDWNPFTSR